MSFAAAIRSAAAAVRGRVAFEAPLAPLTWFRVGGPAEALFSPADEDDLAGFLARLPADVPVTVIGLGSNLIVRDGGVEGVVVRLGGRAFNAIEAMEDCRIVAGAAAPDQFVAKAAATAGVDGLAFLRGVPGAIGGALRMNAGAHGRRDQGRARRGARARPLAARPASSPAPTWAIRTGTAPRRTT